MDVHTGRPEPLPEGGDDPLHVIFGIFVVFLLHILIRNVQKGFLVKRGGYPLPLHLGSRERFF